MCARAGAACWSCVVSRVSGRPLCWGMRPTRLPISRWPALRVSSRRWSCRSRRCISCAGGCWIAWTGCRGRSARLWRWRSDCSLAARRIVSWSGWRCWACCPMWPPASRCWASSMMRSGWIRPRRKCWRSSPAGWTPNRSPCCSVPAIQPERAGLWASPTWYSMDCLILTPGRCWPPRCPGGWMSESATGSSPNPGGTRWRCWNCPARRRRRSWPAGSAPRAPTPGPTGSGRVSRGGFGAFRGPRSGVACWPPAALPLEPDGRAQRALAGGQAKYLAAAFDAALAVLATAETGPLEESQRARAELLRGQIAFASGNSGDAPRLLLKAARQFEPLDVGLARETYLEALFAALFADRPALGGGVREVAEAARAAPPPPQPPRASDLELDGLALVITEGYPAGAPMLKRALGAFRLMDITADVGLHWGWQACLGAGLLWDYGSWDLLSARWVELARDAGALTALPVAAPQGGARAPRTGVRGPPEPWGRAGFWRVGPATERRRAG